ncbi:MAG TPA: hypothetical protein VMU94_30800 [Streptosporangiaceae bacterium]|nr:hypothetical protein [Streptosporangiaceae bacterium]
MIKRLRAPSAEMRSDGSFLKPGRPGRPGRPEVLAGLSTIAAAGVLAACGCAAGSGAAGGGVSGGGAGSGTQHATSARGMVVTARKLGGIGTVLADRSGKMIYSPQQEANGKILCSGSCLSLWFLVSVAPGSVLHAPAGVSGVLGTIRRTDNGLTQLTYNGGPLYTFRLDQAPGQAHGNNFSDQFGSASFTWQAVTTAGTAGGSTQPAKSGGGYSYPAGGSPGY